MPSATSNPLAGDWDVVVIGAGPAGALAARGAAVRGARTLLVERKPFPRSKVCGACLNRAALETLERIGLSQTIGRLGGVPLREFHVRSQGRGLTLPLPEGLALSRSRFDAALVAAAVAAGAEFGPETSAAVEPLETETLAEFRQITLRDCAGTTLVARARVVIVADGLGHSSLDALPEFASRVAAASRIGIGGVLREFPAEYRPGTIFMAVGRAGYAGLVRVEEGALNVAAAIAPEFVRVQGSVPSALAAILTEGGLPPLERSEETVWHGTLPLTRTSPIVAGHRLLLVGDAAGYVEPFTGEGMAWALAGACAVEPFALRGISKWDGALERAWTRQHRSLIARRQRWCRWLSALLRHPRLTQALLSVVARAPQLARPVVRELTAPLRAAKGVWE